MTEPQRPSSTKSVVAERAAWCCEYCLSQACFSPDPFVLEHIVPRSRGGSDDLSNLALACQGCNGHKYTSVEASDPLDGKIVPLFELGDRRIEVYEEPNVGEGLYASVRILTAADTLPLRLPDGRRLETPAAPLLP